MGIRLHSQTIGLPERKFYFNHVGMEQGLPNGMVNDLFRDRRGMLWIGTGNGLVCFDGVHCTTSKADPENPLALENPDVQGICEDTAGNIWCTTELGVSRYDRKRFYNYHLEDAETGEPAILYNWSVQRTHHDQIVACGTGGLFFYDVKADSFVQAIPKGPDGKRLFRGIHKNSMAIDSIRNGIWMGTDKGVAYYDLAKRQYYNYAYNPYHWKAFADHSCHPVVLDLKGRVFYHDADLEAFVTWNPETNDSTQRSTVTWAATRQSFATAYFDPRGNIWISSWNPRAYYWNVSTGQVYRFGHNPRDQYSIAADFFWDVHRDADGTMYFGTSNGLSIVNPQNGFFSILELPEGIEHLSNYATPLLLDVDLQNRLWFAPSYNFLLRYDMQSERFDRFDLFGIPDLRDFQRKRISSMAATEDTLYFGTTDGIYTFDVRTERFAKLPYLPVSLGLEGHYLVAMTINRRGELWAFVTDTGILRIDLATHAYQLYTTDPNAPKSIPARFIGEIIEDSRGEMWANSQTIGVLHYDRTSDKFDLMPKEVYTKIGFCQEFIVDGQGKVWTLSNTAGLMCYDPQTRQLYHDTYRGQLDHLAYGSLLLDKDQRLWLTVYNDFAILDVREGTATNFRINHSRDDTRWANHLFALPDGRIASESRNALIFFDPEVRKQSALVDPILISHFAGIDTSIAFPDQVESIDLKYWQNYFSIDFGSIDLLKNGERKWQYRLEGFDPQWIDCGARRTAYYTNVPSGSYTFEVRVRDFLGEWHMAEHPVHIEIGQVFYKTLAFKIFLIFLLLLGLVGWGRALQRRNQKREYERAINYFANSLHVGHGVEDILWDITDNVITRTDLVDCVIYMVDEKGDFLVKVASYGEKNAQEYGQANPSSIPMGRGVVGRAAASQKAEIVPDTRKHPHYIPSQMRGRSEISVPIVHDGKVLGVIDAEDPRKNFFKKRHLDLLSTIASISASKIAHAQQATEIREKELRLKALQTQVSETRQLALRAQMNPHFIFNCLNSINSFILENDSDTASTYLIKFSRLIRLILENSNDKYISLQSELDALKLYIEMESLRFSTKFRWAIEVDEEVASHHIMVPPLILQPFVENAIWHGLLHQDTPGALLVRISQEGQTLRCIIEDDGVGRAASAKFKEQSLNKKQSLGMKLTEERFALMNAQEDKKFVLRITDKLGPAGEALGTIVYIEMEI